MADDCTPPLLLHQNIAMKHPLTLLASALLLGFSSCTEDPTTTEMLTDGRWQLKTLTINPGVIVSGVVITDYYNQMHEYDKDNILEFKADGTFITDEGATKEFPSDPQTKQGNWLLSANEDMLTVWMQQDTVVYGLVNIAEAAMTLTYSQRDTSTNVNYTLTAGFEKY
jgi:hypothetical protein